MESDSGNEIFPIEISASVSTKKFEGTPKPKTGQKGNYKCDKCNHSFTLSGNYRRHIRHNKICGSIKEGFKCKNCNKVFSLNATMKDHYLRCTAEDPYRFECPHCPKLFTFKSSLNKHLRGRCSYLKKNGKEPPKLFKCEYCIAEFYTQYAYRMHVSFGSCTMENEPQKQVCPYCGNGFTMKSSLHKHMKGRCKKMKDEEYSQNSYEHFEEITESYSSIEIDVDIDQPTQEEIDTSYEVIDEGDVIEERPDEWESYIESYIEIAPEEENCEQYEFIKVND